MSDYEIRTIGLDEVLPLRVALLDRAGQGHAGPSAGDEHPSARHVGAFHDEQLIGVASVHPQGMPGGYKTNSWRLAGVGVDFGHRGVGVGALLVERCLEHGSERGGRISWCLAPAGTYGFFERLGFRRSGDPIDDPERGPHYLLYQELRPLRRSWALEDA